MADIVRKINRARRMPPAALIKALFRLAKLKTRRYLLWLLPVRLSDKNLLRAVGLRTVDELLGRELPPFFFEPNNRDEITGTVKKEYPASIKETINDADEICRHRFDLLGSGKKELDKEIDWHLDFKSGFRWDPKTYYLGSSKHVECYLSQGLYADVKVPWELSRCQHLATLGKAYWYAHEEKYAREFVSQIEGWITQNPVEFGVNWTCTMDVAIRAVNWIWGYYFLCHSESLTREFRVGFHKSLLEHGRHIINNLEYDAVRGNHYLSDIVGLVYLGVFFPESKEGKRWLKKGRSALEEEMGLQVYPEGVDFESSISYHRLVTELFLSATLLCLKNNIAFPEWYLERLAGMVEFIMHYTKPDGTAPQIGDNDDGRLHILANYGSWNRTDHRYLLAIGAAWFERADFKQAAGEFHEEAFWLLGGEGLGKFNGQPEPKLPLKSRDFSQAGFYIMRWDNLYMIVDCLKADARAPTGHRHNSRLSFELFAYDKSFIIDPGAYIYTADKEMRNLFRSTGYHSSLVVDGEEQGRFDEDELFSMGLDASVKVNRWQQNNTQDYLDAEHSGYGRLENPVTHRRLILFNKVGGYWLIRDALSGRGEHQFDLYFHFAPLKAGIDRQSPLVVKTETAGANLAIIPLEGEDENISVELLEGWVSSGYGVREKAPVVKYSKRGTVPTSFCFAVYPYIMGVSTEKIIKELKGANIAQLMR